MDLYTSIKIACIQQGIRLQDFAKSLGISRQALYDKCYGGVTGKGFQWTSDQTEKLEKLLNFLRENEENEENI